MQLPRADRCFFDEFDKSRSGVVTHAEFRLLLEKIDLASTGGGGGGGSGAAGGGGGGGHHHHHSRHNGRGPRHRRNGAGRNGGAEEEEEEVAGPSPLEADIIAMLDENGDGSITFGEVPFKSYEWRGCDIAVARRRLPHVRREVPFKSYE